MGTINTPDEPIKNTISPTHIFIFIVIMAILIITLITSIQKAGSEIAKNNKAEKEQKQSILGKTITINEEQYTAIRIKENFGNYTVITINKNGQEIEIQKELFK